MIPDSFWERMKNIQRIHLRLYAGGKGWIVGRFILLLTHTGRRSGTRYVTPLQYEKIDGAYCVGAGRGLKADWYRNILADPVTDPGRVADFLEYRRKHHPLMIGLLMKFAHKLPMHPSRAQFLELSKSTPLVILRPPAIRAA